MPSSGQAVGLPSARQGRVPTEPADLLVAGRPHHFCIVLRENAQRGMRIGRGIGPRLPRRRCVVVGVGVDTEPHFRPRQWADNDQEFGWKRWWRRGVDSFRQLPRIAAAVPYFNIDPSWLGPTDAGASMGTRARFVVGRADGALR